MSRKAFTDLELTGKLFMRVAFGWILLEYKGPLLMEF